MLNLIKNYLKHKFAKDELNELTVLKLRINDLKYWCSEYKEVSIAAQWLQDPQSYPCQLKGAHGSIDDFREYLRKLKDDKEEIS